MNALFRWPTNVPLPKFRVRRITTVGLGILLASCGESVTQPGQRAPATTTPAWRPTPDIVVMERITTSATNDGEAPIVRRSREVLTPQIRIAGNALNVRALAAPTTAMPVGLPLPTLSLPARNEVAICSTLPSWTERSKGAESRDVVLTGVGDAPASTIKLTQADGSVSSVERSWTRTATTWQLDRQVTTGAKGFRDVVSYQHQNANGKILNNAIPSTGCTGQQRLIGQASLAASRTFYAPYSTTLYSKLVPGSGVFADQGCFDGLGDPCFDKRITVIKDELAVLATSVSMGVACLTPVAVTVGPCAIAVTAYYLAIGYLVLDQMSYQNCLNESRNRLPELSVGVSPPSATLTPSVSGSVAVRTPTVGAVGDCGFGGATGVAGTRCHWDTWEITYDGGESWQYFATFLICENAL